MSSNPESELAYRRRRRPEPRIVWGLVVVGFLWAGYMAVKAGVRAWVDHRIEAVEGRALIEFSLTDLEGRRWSSADLRGRTVLLNFVRSNCANCLREKDEVRRLAAAVDPAKVMVLGVLLDRVQGYDEATTARTIERMAWDHPVLIADEAFVEAFHGAGWAHVTPVTYLIDPEGRISGSLRGFQSFDSLVAALPAGSLR